MRKIYVLCPSDTVTGGIELLHQLVDVLRNQNIEAYIKYIGNETAKIPNAYLKYNLKIADSVSNIEESIIVIPEVFFYLLPKFDKAYKVVLWWLSVDNFINDSCSFDYLFTNNFYNRKLKNRLIQSYFKKIIKLFLFKPSIFQTISIHKLVSYSNLINACQSQYAMDFCEAFGFKNICLLSDFINTEFLEHEKTTKKDVIIYNPKKGKQFTKKLIKSAKNLTFVPICNMSRDQVKQLMFDSKVYIDFGNHPGKDRMPREACLCDCLIITGKDGAAYNEKDIEIPEYYKLAGNKKNIKEILSKIENCLKEYDIRLSDFLSYKNKILNEKKEFEDQAINLFSQIVQE